MKKNLTELVFVLDKSGSMYNLTADTIGGFNSVIKKHNDGEGEVLVTTYLFNDSSVMLHDRLPIDRVGLMTENEYRVSGCTALYDALGDAVRHIAGIHKYSRPEDIPEHTIFVIITDGMENSSSRFSGGQIKAMVRHEQEKYGWEFIYLAANIDAAENACSIGIDENHAVNYHADGTGTRVLYDCVDEAVSQIRRCEPLAQKASWRKRADEDFKNRSK